MTVKTDFQKEVELDVLQTSRKLHRKVMTLLNNRASKNKMTTVSFLEDVLNSWTNSNFAARIAKQYRYIIDMKNNVSNYEQSNK